MGNGKFHFSLTGALYQLGSRIQFAPPSAFASSRKEDEKQMGRLASRLLPYQKKVKGALSKMAEQSAILELLRRLVKYIFTLRLRSLGIFFFLCGFVRIAAYFALPALTSADGNVGHLLFGVAQIFLALICSFSRGDVADSLKKSFFFRGILQSLLGIKEWQIPGGKSRDRGATMFLLGLGFGILSALLPAAYLSRSVLVFALILFVFFSPEAGLALSMASALLLDVQSMFLLVLLTLVSFFFKCSVGKRSLIVSPMDPAVFLFVLPFLASAPQTDEKGFFALFFLYALVACLVRTLASVIRLLSTVTAVSFVLALFVSARRCVELFAPLTLSRVEGLDAFFFVKADAVTGILIAMSVPLIIGMMRGRISLGKRFTRFLSLAVHLAGLAFIGDRNVWLAAILGVMVYVAFSFRGGLIFLSVTGLTVISVLRLLPPAPASAVLRFFGVQADLAGELSHVPTQGLLEYFYRHGGIFWIAAFLILIGFFAYEMILFCLKTANPRIHFVVFGVVCAVVVFVSASIQNVELDYRTVALFLMLLSLPRAAHRAALREEVRLPY